MAEETMQPDQEKKGEEKTSFKQDLYYWTQALIVVLVGLILVCTLAGRVIRVVGSSMVPTLHENDLLLLRSVGYTPQRGDVIVLRKESFLSYPVVKRVIATGGFRHRGRRPPGRALYQRDHGGHRLAQYDRAGRDGA